MAVALRIARLHNQIQGPADGLEEGLEPGLLQEMSQRALPAALAGVAERALSRAGLPVEAAVAVRRLSLRLHVGDGASEADLLRGWSGALEEALVRSLARVRAASVDDVWERSGLAAPSETSQEVVVFADVWAAEAAHLRGLLRSGRPAWWAERVLDGRGEPLDLAPLAILSRWLERQPARAVAAMAQLASLPPGGLEVSTLLSEGEARVLADGLARQLSQRPGGDGAPPAAGTALRALLEVALGTLRRHPQVGLGSGASAGRSLPWRLALLLRAQPSLSLLSPATLLAVAETLAAVPPIASGAEHVITPNHGGDDNTNQHPEVAGEPVVTAQSPRGTSSDNPSPPMTKSGAPPDGPPPAAPPGPQAMPTQQPTLLEQAWIHAGGLWLLLNRPELLHPTERSYGEEPSPSAAGDLALHALHRLLAPLGPGERAAALHRERPLLALLAPDHPWPERLQDAVVHHPEEAERQLAALIAAIPEGVSFAPGALRQVYGPRHGGSPPLPDRDSHRLAALLWRPGLLAWDRWQITLAWPLASADGALRRQGWDLDPGWQPALRRVVRFIYRADVQPPQEVQP